MESGKGNSARHGGGDLKFSERDDGIIDIDATIYCEKASHKGIIIGKQGAMLKKISSQARADCERFMGTKVYLQTWVRRKGKLARQSVPHLELRLRRPAVILLKQHQAVSRLREAACFKK